MTAPVLCRPALVAALAAAAAVGVWFGLSIWTGLIFHLMPAAPPLAAAWAWRRSAPGGVPGAAVLIPVGIGIVSAVAGARAVQAAGGALDAPGWILVAGLGGVVLAIRVARRP